MRRQLPMLVWMILLASGAVAQEVDVPAAAEDAPSVAFFDAYGTLLIGVLILALLVGLGGWAYMLWKRREPVPRYLGGREVETSQYEQVLSELQGIKLRIHGAEAKTFFPKIERLVHIFADRRGVPGAREMSNEQLIRALDGELFTPQQAEKLREILERCESAAGQTKGKLEFDPMQVIIDFQTIVYQVDNREPPRHQYPAHT